MKCHSVSPLPKEFYGKFAICRSSLKLWKEPSECPSSPFSQPQCSLIQKLIQPKLAKTPAWNFIYCRSFPLYCKPFRVIYLCQLGMQHRGSMGPAKLTYPGSITGTTCAFITVMTKFNTGNLCLEDQLLLWAGGSRSYTQQQTGFFVDIYNRISFRSSKWAEKYPWNFP